MSDAQFNSPEDHQCLVDVTDLLDLVASASIADLRVEALGWEDDQFVAVLNALDPSKGVPERTRQNAVTRPRPR